MLHFVAHLLSNFASDDHDPRNYGMWIFLSVGAVCLFGVFIPLVSWIEGRRKEREAFYKAETLRRLAEASGDGARAALELIREEHRIKQLKQMEGLKIGGLVNVAVGIGLGIMLYTLTGSGGPYLVGAIPGLIGVALLVFAFFMAEPVQ
jgi:hypothetical protein